MDTKNTTTNKALNAQAVAELRDRLIWFVAMRELNNRQRFHWIGGCVPVTKN